MEVLTDPELEAILKRLDTLVTELEQAPSACTFFAFVLTAQAVSEMKPRVAALAHIRHYLTLAHRMLPIRTLVDSSMRWSPLRQVVEVITSDAARLTTLYGVARPSVRPHRQRLRQAFYAVFTQATGKTYHLYADNRSAKERTTITAFWAEALRTALARFEAEGTPEALDEVMACVPAWADRSHERWQHRRWREPSVKEVMQMLTDYLAVWDLCLGTLTQIAEAALAQAPVVERAAVTQAVAQEYTAQLAELREAIRVFTIPKEAPKAQQTQLRKEKSQLQQTLKTLHSAQEAEITRQLKQGAAVQHKLATLVKTVQGYPDTVRRKAGKACVDMLLDIIWIYEYEREGGEDWHRAKLDTRRFIREVRRTYAPSGAVTVP